MNSAVRIQKTVKFGSGVDARIYEEGQVLQPPLPAEIVDELNSGSGLIVLLKDAKRRPNAKYYDYVSEPEFKTPDMSKYKTTASHVVKPPEVVTEVNKDKPKLKLVKRTKLVKRRKK